MDNEIWYLSDDFNKLSAKDVLTNILIADKKNFQRAESELNQDIRLLDEALALFIETLQAASKRADEWKSEVTLRASIAMANSALDYFLLARHGVLIGYYQEVRSLLRACHEHMTRCYLFYADEEVAQKFLSGEEIKQWQVDGMLAKMLGEEDEDKDEAHKYLREHYVSESKLIHPNIGSLEIRTGSTVGADFYERVGVYHQFGGVMSSFWGKAGIAIVLRNLIFALKIIRPIVKEGTGAWDEEYDKISDKYNELVTELRDYVTSLNP